MFNADLRDEDSPRRLIDEVLERFGRLDVLVNNARGSTRRRLLEESEADWDEEMAVSLKSPYFLAKYAIECMTSGAIVNLGSITSRFVSHESAAYQIAKGATEHLTRVLAFAGAPRVRVNAVLPGMVLQDEHQARYARMDNAQYRRTVEDIHPLRRPCTSDEVARAVLFLSSEQASFITGTSLVVDGGLTVQELGMHMLKPGEAMKAQA